MIIKIKDYYVDTNKICYITKRNLLYTDNCGIDILFVGNSEETYFDYKDNKTLRDKEFEALLSAMTTKENNIVGRIALWEGE